jgi:hypothetical protein
MNAEKTGWEKRLTIVTSTNKSLFLFSCFHVFLSKRIRFYFRTRGSNASRNPSPRKLSASKVSVMKPPGKISIHQ